MPMLLVTDLALAIIIYLIAYKHGYNAGVEDTKPKAVWIQKCLLCDNAVEDTEIHEQLCTVCVDEEAKPSISTCSKCLEDYDTEELDANMVCSDCP